LYVPAEGLADPRRPGAGVSFVGWDRSENLTIEQGPFEELGLPVARMGLAPVTVLEWASLPETVPQSLHAKVRRNIAGPLRIAVAVDGVQAQLLDLGFREDFVVLDVPLPEKPGARRIELRYETDGTPLDAGHLVALYFELTILPRERP